MYCFWMSSGFVLDANQPKSTRVGRKKVILFCLCFLLFCWSIQIDVSSQFAMFTSIWSSHNFLKIELYNNVFCVSELVRWSVCDNIRSSNHKSLWNRHILYILHLCLFHNALSFSSVTCSNYFHFGWFKVFAWTIVASQANTTNWLFPFTSRHGIHILVSQCYKHFVRKHVSL